MLPASCQRTFQETMKGSIILKVQIVINFSTVPFSICKQPISF